MLKKIEKSIFLTKPIIGIVARKIDNIYKVNENIVKKIINNGGIPILILPTNFNDLLNILNICDGILMPGGSDIYECDRFIYKYATENDVPILGICLGMQIMEEEYLSNTKTLHQGINHSIITKKGSIINRLVGDVVVNSRHNERITDTKNHDITAWSTDGCIEAIEHKNNKFNVGVQWHPEDLDNDLLFKEFIIACNTNRSF